MPGDAVKSFAEAKAGKIQVSGRYLKSPHHVEDDYEIDKSKDGTLGTGLNGEVKRAKRKVINGEPKSNDYYAIKPFSLNGMSAKDRENLDLEVEVFLCMDHPHVARLTAVYDEADKLTLVMECMTGGELFDRVVSHKRYSEKVAAETTYQLLLAVNYLHTSGIVHRDLKMENFLYESATSSHLKLIDFGFSKFFDKNTKLVASCGTLSYVAPEVLKKNYDSKCDLWSLGVIVFIILSGYMPFCGSDRDQVKAITAGKYNWKPDRWKGISSLAQDFMKRLLTVEVAKRLSAPQALEHPWIHRREHSDEVHIDMAVADALKSFGHASKFRRACMNMMAWSLTNEERAKVREAFLDLDKDKNGTISLNELRDVLKQFDVKDQETDGILHAMDSHEDHVIHYSDFLAAMVNTRIQMHDGLIRDTFRKFDSDDTGFITVQNLHEVLGDEFDDTSVEELLKEADLKHDGKISYGEFKAFLLCSNSTDPAQDEKALKMAMAVDAKFAKELAPGPGKPAQSEAKPCCSLM